MRFGKQVTQKLSQLTRRKSEGEFNQGYRLGHEDGINEGEEYGYQAGFLEGKREAEISFKVERDQYESEIAELELRVKTMVRNYLQCIKEHPQRRAPRPSPRQSFTTTIS